MSWIISTLNESPAQHQIHDALDRAPHRQPLFVAVHRRQQRHGHGAAVLRRLEAQVRDGSDWDTHDCAHRARRHSERVSIDEIGSASHITMRVLWRLGDPVAGQGWKVFITAVAEQHKDLLENVYRVKCKTPSRRCC